MDDVKLNKYVVYVKLTVFGESPEDAAYYATSAIDTSDLLEQDGVISIDLIDDPDAIELMEDDDEDAGDDDGF
jgi:PDZ domain-containing secreted protein